jgi:hypothetical protein
VHDAPGLEVDVCWLNDVSDLVDLSVEFFLSVQEFAVLWLLDRGEHLIAIWLPTYPLSPTPVGRAHREKDTGFAEGAAIVAAPFDGIGNTGELSIEGGRDLHVHADGPVLPECSSG